MRKITWKDLLIVLLDIIAVNASYLIALYARFYGITVIGDVFYSYVNAFWQFAPFYTVICLLAFWQLKLYNGMWRYAGINDVNRIIFASVMTSLIHVFGTIIFVKKMPLSYYVVGSVFQIVALFVIRLGYRVFLMERGKLIRHSSPSENTMIVGHGADVKKVLDYISSSTFNFKHDGNNNEEKTVNGGSASASLRPVVVVDDKVAAGKMMNGVPVVKSNDIDAVIEKYKVRNIIIADPFIENGLRKKIEKESENRHLELVDMGGYLSLLGNDKDAAASLMEVQAKPATVNDKRIIPFSPPDISSAEIGEVTEALKSGWITTGPRTKLLERRLAAYIETGKTDVDVDEDKDRWSNRVVCLNSATAAEELNLRILGVRKGDEVIVPAYTYTASASAAIHCGATVKFVDIQKDGDKVTKCPEMDYEKLEAAITPATKAIVLVDLGGIVADYQRVFEIVEKKKALFKPLNDHSNPLSSLGSKIQAGLGRVAVVCDAAHALGASRITEWCGKGKEGKKKRYVGSIADFTSFSFHAVKNFTTAEGGASTWCLPSSVYEAGVTDAEIYKLYQLLSLHGQNKDALAKTKIGAWEYDIIGPWYKCNMTDIMAAIGLRQLDRYSRLLERRVQIMKKYDSTCEELGISHLVHHTPYMDSSNHLYLIRVPGANEEIRNKMIEKMAERGVATNVHYKPLPMMTAYGKDCSAYPNAYDYYHNLITLPLHTLLSDEDVEYVCDCLKDVMREVR